MARPRKSEADLAVAVTISASSDALLENFVKSQIPKHGFQSESTSHINKSIKRSILDGLVVRELGIEGRFPYLDVTAPIETIDDKEREEAEDWLNKKKRELGRQAPRAIKRALEANIRARKIERAIESGDQEALDRARTEKVTLPDFDPELAE